MTLRSVGGKCRGDNGGEGGVPHSTMGYGSTERHLSFLPRRFLDACWKTFSRENSCFFFFWPRFSPGDELFFVNFAFLVNKMFIFVQNEKFYPVVKIFSKSFPVESIHLEGAVK